MKLKRNVLSDDELKYVQETLKQEKWGFGYISTDYEKPIWNFDKQYGKEIAELLSSKFEGTLIDWHINGQTYQLSGSPHDDSANGCTTAVVYFPFDWKFEWGGRLNIFNENGVMIITPEKNLAVVFDSKLKHYAEAPITNKLRVSIGLKLK
jgi:Rps23 Pro-64 3,4-dihydroxylase Tpa1-like proline 4-hydroxylase